MDENKKTDNDQKDQIIELGSDISKSSKGNIYTLIFKLSLENKLRLMN